MPTTQRSSASERYLRLKKAEVELSAFAIKLQEEQLTRGEAGLLDAQLREARSMVYSSKTQMDIRESIAMLRHSEADELKALYSRHRKFTRRIYSRYLELSSAKLPQEAIREEVQGLLRENDAQFQQVNEETRKAVGIISGEHPGLPSVLNINRDMHHSIKDLLQGILAE